MSYEHDQRVANAVGYVEGMRAQEAINAEWERVLAVHPEIEPGIFRAFAEQALEAGDPNFDAAVGRYNAVLAAAAEVEAEREQSWQPPEHAQPEPQTMGDAADELLAELRVARGR